MALDTNISNFHYEFLSNVDVGKPADCWPWKKSLVSGRKFGTIYTKAFGVKKRLTTLQATYLLEHKKLPPDGERILHVGGSANCCNPKHLYLESEEPPVIEDEPEEEVAFVREIKSMDMEAIAPVMVINSRSYHVISDLRSTLNKVIDLMNDWCSGKSVSLRTVEELLAEARNVSLASNMIKRKGLSLSGT